MKIYLLLIGTLIVSFTGFSQKNTFAEDTSWISAQYDTIENIEFKQIDSALILSKVCLQKSREIEYLKGITTGLRWVAHLQTNLGNFSIALENLYEARELYTKENDIRNMGAVANSIGYNYKRMGRIEEAVKEFTVAMKLYESLDDKGEIANCYNNLAAIYDTQGLYDEAFEYYRKALSAALDEGDKSSVATAYNNIGVVHYYIDDKDSAIYYINLALKWYLDCRDPVGISSVYSSLGFFFQEEGNKDSALVMYQRSIDALEGSGRPSKLSSTLVNLSTFYLEEGDYQKSYSLARRALDIGLEVNDPNTIDYAAHQLHSVCIKLNRFEEALEAFKLSKKMEDSISNLTNKNIALQDKFAFEFGKKKAIDSVAHANETALLDAQIKQGELRDEKKNIAIILSAIALAILSVFGIIIYRRFKITRKQKTIIQRQKDVVDEKNREIMDSIHYAKRIQAAVLPPKKVVKEYLQDSFILYKPKDVVAGDFYWMETAGNKILFAACDCTGHGVPGALVSVVCNNGLNRAVREYNLTEPGKILDKAREIVISEFEKSEEDVRDGMDVALVCLEGNQLEFAGANNPLWLIRDGELIELKGDKQPIGKYDKPCPFNTYKEELKKGDLIYLFSDGYADQFGGIKGKKLKSSTFKTILLKIHEESMERQREILDEQFEEWRGDLEQIDDVCVIGVRV